MAKLDTQNSIVDYLKSQGQDSSYSARKKLATELCTLSRGVILNIQSILRLCSMLIWELVEVKIY